MYTVAAVLWMLGILGLAWGALSSQTIALPQLIFRYGSGCALFALGCAVFLYVYLQRPMV